MPPLLRVAAWLGFLTLQHVLTQKQSHNYTLAVPVHHEEPRLTA